MNSEVVFGSFVHEDTCRMIPVVVWRPFSPSDMSARGIQLAKVTRSYLARKCPSI